MDLFLDTLFDEVQDRMEMFVISDTLFFHIFRALLFQQSPLVLSGTNGHDIFRFTEICNQLTYILFKNPKPEVQEKFLIAIRELIKRLSSDSKLHEASNKILLSSVSHIFEANKKILADRLLQERTKDEISHPEKK